MSGCVEEAVKELLQKLLELVAGVDAGALDDAAASGLIEAFVVLERLAEAGRLLATAELTSEVWRRQGFRSAAAWMAARAGKPVGRPSQRWKW